MEVCNNRLLFWFAPLSYLPLVVFVLSLTDKPYIRLRFLIKKNKYNTTFFVTNLNKHKRLVLRQNAGNGIGNPTTFFYLKIF